jgi:hypothetical protein
LPHTELAISVPSPPPPPPPPPPTDVITDEDRAAAEEEEEELQQPDAKRKKVVDYTRDDFTLYPDMYEQYSESNIIVPEFVTGSFANSMMSWVVYRYPTGPHTFKIQSPAIFTPSGGKTFTDVKGTKYSMILSLGSEWRTCEQRSKFYDIFQRFDDRCCQQITENKWAIYPGSSDTNMSIEQVRRQFIPTMSESATTKDPEKKYPMSLHASLIMNPTEKNKSKKTRIFSINQGTGRVTEVMSVAEILPGSTVRVILEAAWLCRRTDKQTKSYRFSLHVNVAQLFIESTGAVDSSICQIIR